VNKSPAVILTDAVEILRRNGHFKGGYVLETGTAPFEQRPVCAIGAILIAAEGDPRPEMPGVLGETASAAARVLARSIHSTVVDDDPIERIADWNDAEDRTPDEVMQAMTVAAEEWAA
jgi:hypothetical protein